MITLRSTSTRLAVVLGAGALAIAAFTGCSSGAAPTEPADGGTSADASTPDAGSGGSDTGSGSGGGAVSVDVCGLVPTAELAAVIGTDPGQGTASIGAGGLPNCKWDISETHTVLLQYTEDADTYLPESLYPKPEDGGDIEGVTRGWVSPGSRTVIAVKGTEGVYLVDIAVGADVSDDLSTWVALGNAIAARM